MSNRTDFDNQAREFLEWMRSASADEAQARLERELHDAFVAGQESEHCDECEALKHEIEECRAAICDMENNWRPVEQ